MRKGARMLKQQCDATCVNVYFSDRPLEPSSHIGMSQETQAVLTVSRQVR